MGFEKMWHSDVVIDTLTSSVSVFVDALFNPSLFPRHHSEDETTKNPFDTLFVTYLSHDHVPIPTPNLSNGMKLLDIGLFLWKGLSGAFAFFHRVSTYQD